MRDFVSGRSFFVDEDGVLDEFDRNGLVDALREHLGEDFWYPRRVAGQARRRKMPHLVEDGPRVEKLFFDCAVVERRRDRTISRVQVVFRHFRRMVAIRAEFEGAREWRVERTRDVALA
ncbi:hypothetical protein [Paludisphaera mucosa]|uniref:Uncharacterized protein n=1 Tax=Paludisphaera mucosa TaxID=3030827 RepID=A0ABT6F773_9BACT|nr:hypothetical protein [Paludisphaera mucosa]MDG3003259.1 hypothetical protein [Paludisphaera mucosa]